MYFSFRISVKYAKSTSKLTAEGLTQKRQKLRETFEQFEKDGNIYMSPGTMSNDVNVFSPSAIKTVGSDLG